MINSSQGDFLHKHQNLDFFCTYVFESAIQPIGTDAIMSYLKDNTMQDTINIHFPKEVILSMHINTDEFAEIMKQETAFSLFKSGKISSGIAAKWLNMPRLKFLLKAMERGAIFLEDDRDDLRRESILL